MKIEVLPKIDGYRVLFLDANLVTAAKIKRFSLAMLSGMGHQFGEVKIKEEDNFFFFDLISSSDGTKLLKDLFYSLDKATRDIIKEERA